jgi:chitin disaccharide deacetylase
VVAPRLLIVNADDFGRSEGVNRGIVAAHEHGIVTSASLMVRWPAAVAAARYARDHPGLSVGLHVDCGEWACRPDGEWVRLYQVVPDDDAGAIAGEVERQVEAFRGLMGREPTHLDSHQHVHRSDPARSVLRRVARELGVPLRGGGRTVRYEGCFYGQDDEGRPYPELIGVDALVEALGALRPGWTELGCHPGLGADLDSMYLPERETEVRTLCDRRVRAAVARLGIELRSFHDVRGRRSHAEAAAR